MIEPIGYKRMHKLIEKIRGKAHDQICVDCSEPAYAWSYNHTDPDELIDPSNGLSYGTDQKYYSARCTLCHATLDKVERNAAKPAVPAWVSRIKALQTQAARGNNT